MYNIKEDTLSWNKHSARVFAKTLELQATKTVALGYIAQIFTYLVDVRIVLRVLYLRYRENQPTVETCPTECVVLRVTGYTVC